MLPLLAACVILSDAEGCVNGYNVTTVVALGPPTVGISGHHDVDHPDMPRSCRSTVDIYKHWDLQSRYNARDSQSCYLCCIFMYVLISLHM